MWGRILQSRGGIETYLQEHLFGAHCTLDSSGFRSGRMPSQPIKDMKFFCVVTLEIGTKSQVEDSVSSLQAHCCLGHGVGLACGLY